MSDKHTRPWSLPRAARLAAVLAVTAGVPAFAQATSHAASASTATTIIKKSLPHWGVYAVVVTVPPPAAPETVSVFVGSQSQLNVAVGAGQTKALAFGVHLRSRTLQVRTVSSDKPVSVTVAVAKQPAGNAPPPVVTGPSGTTGATGTTDATGTTGATGPVTFRAPASGPYNRLVWADEFNTPAGTPPNPQNWSLDNYGGCGNNTLSTNTQRPSNASTDGHGSLAITAAQDPTSPGYYTSAQIDGRGHFSLLYGRIEARIEIPSASGLCSAFWMSGDAPVQPCFPACGEIDIMEAISHFPTYDFATLHGPVTGSGNFQQWQSWVTSATALAGHFHTYGLIWQRGRMTWTIDGVPYATATRASLPPSGRWVFDNQPMYLVFDLAVGGWPGAPTSAAGFPAALHVDWVRVYD